MTDENKSLVDKFFESGREALRPGKLLLRLVFIVVSLFILGAKQVAHNLNEFGVWKGFLMTFWMGFAQALTDWWEVFSDIFTGWDQLSQIPGTIALFVVYTLLITFVIYPIVKTILDIADFKKGQAFGFFVNIGVTFMVIVMLSFTFHQAGWFEPELKINGKEENSIEPEGGENSTEEKTISNAIDMIEGG